MAKKRQIQGKNIRKKNLITSYKKVINPFHSALDEQLKIGVILFSKNSLWIKLNFYLISIIKDI